MEMARGNLSSICHCEERSEETISYPCVLIVCWFQKDYKERLLRQDYALPRNDKKKAQSYGNSKSTEKRDCFVVPMALLAMTGGRPYGTPRNDVGKKGFTLPRNDRRKFVIAHATEVSLCFVIARARSARGNLRSMGHNQLATVL